MHTDKVRLEKRFASSKNSKEQRHYNKFWFNYNILKFWNVFPVLFKIQKKSFRDPQIILFILKHVSPQPQGHRKRNVNKIINTHIQDIDTMNLGETKQTVLISFLQYFCRSCVFSPIKNKIALKLLVITAICQP